MLCVVVPLMFGPHHGNKRCFRRYCIIGPDVILACRQFWLQMQVWPARNHENLERIQNGSPPILKHRIRCGNLKDMIMIGSLHRLHLKRSPGIEGFHLWDHLRRVWGVEQLFSPAPAACDYEFPLLASRRRKPGFSECWFHSWIGKAGSSAEIAQVPSRYV